MIKEVSAGVVVFKDDLVLIIKHKNGHIDFPKGHVEGNEALEETAIREVFEETGIKCRIDSDDKYIITYSPKDGVLKDVYYFIGSYESGELKPQLEEVEYTKFVKIEEALKIITYDNSRGVLEKIIEKRKD